MQKFAISRLFNRRPLLLCLVLLALGGPSALAQEPIAAAGSRPAPTTPPTDPKTLMHQAAEANSLTWTGAQPWHIKASFQLFDDQGKLADQGTYEESWVSATKSRRIFTSTTYNGTEFVTEKGILRTGAHDVAPDLLLQIRSQFINPIALTYDQLENSTFATEKPKAGAPPLRCIPVPGSETANPPQPFGGIYCLDPNLPAVRIVLRNGYAQQVLRTNLKVFQGCYLAQDLQGYPFSGGPPLQDMKQNLMFKAHLDTAEALTTINDADFTPPLDATPLPKQIEMGEIEVRKHLLQHPLPVYPPIARAARVDGAVVLKATISADGTVINLRVVSGNAMLQSAAMDGVRKWTFKPFVVDGAAVQVKTTFTVPFNLASY
jgi:TonB family protein